MFYFYENANCWSRAYFSFVAQINYESMSQREHRSLRDVLAKYLPLA